MARNRPQVLIKADVRFGSKADISQCNRHVRPIADIVSQKKDRLAAVSPNFNLRVTRAEVSARFTPDQIGGTEFLVDASGWLRAMWWPGLMPDWNEPSVLAREIDRIRRAPGQPRPVAPACACALRADLPSAFEDRRGRQLRQQKKSPSWGLGLA